MPVIVQFHHQSISEILVISRIAYFEICEEDTQISHREIPSQYHLRGIGMQHYKSACKTAQQIHWVLFIIP